MTIVDISDPTDRPLPLGWEFARRAEAAGFDGVGRADHQDSGRDVFMELGVAARHTTRVALFPCVSNVLSRHPSVLASIVNSLDELSSGRARLVLGAGDTAARVMGRPPAGVDVLRDGVVAIRALLRGDAARFGHGADVRLRHVPAKPPKVIVKASSPRMLELAGEVADGAFCMVGIAPAMVDEARRAIARGAARAGRDPAGVRFMLGVPVFVDSNEERARLRARRILGVWLGKPSRIFGRQAAAMGIPLPEAPGEAAIPESVLERLCDAMGLVGTPWRCAERLARCVAETGAAHVVCQLYGAAEQADEVLEAFERHILKAMK